MISKTSFFNKGIYKSTVKRYAWGSVLYFIVLFLSTTLSVFLNYDETFRYLPLDHFNDYPIILHGSYIALPILLAIVVPTIVALMVFRFIHSKKQAVFIHSLPVSRKANFISSILAAFTLMCVPVIANGIILIFISLLRYGSYFTVLDCVWWMIYNLSGLFLMFSVSVFSANLTGNSFAMIVINFIVHIFVFITVASFGIMAEAFIYGYRSTNAIYDVIADGNFAYFVFGFTNKNFREDIGFIQASIHCAFALMFYIVSYFLYKKRKLEASGDVAGYKCLNIIFKYLVTFLGTMFGFAVFADYMGDNYIVLAIIMAIISLIAYAASEMILKKTFNIIGSWKGYVGFAAFFIIITLIFSQTSFFGYETRIPEISRIEEAGIYEYYFNSKEPYTDNEVLIENITDIHKELIKDIPISQEKGYKTEYSTYLHIKYKLKNGKLMERTYPVSSNKSSEIMNEFYKDEEYRKKCEDVFIDNSRITEVFVNYENKVEDYEELVDAIKEDTLNLSYEDLHPYEYNGNDNIYSIRIQYVPEIRDEKKVTSSSLDQVYINITPKYEKSVEWLKEKGYSKFQ